MWDLRWVLVGLGALVVIGVYLWSKGYFNRRLLPRLPRRAERVEPSIGDTAAVPQPQESFDSSPPVASPAPAAAPVSPPVLERVIALRLIPRNGELPAERVVAALNGAELEHGRYGIFHRPPHVGTEPLFSVANLTEPGTFDLETLAENSVAGLTFFIVLPGTGDPVERFDAMVAAARMLSVELDGELHDERGSSWSIQRERYLREEIIEYRHQSDRR